MADELKNIKDGLQTALQTITGLRVFDQSVESVNEFPAAVILNDPIDYEVQLGGDTFSGELRVLLLVAQADALGAWEALDSYLAPLGTSSIKAAIKADPTLGGKVDWAKLRRAENIRMREMWGGVYVGADFLVQYLKQA